MRWTAKQEGSRTCLYERDPVAIKDALSHEILDLFREGRVHERGLRRDLCDERIGLFLLDALFEKDFGCLGEDEADEELDDLATEVGGGCMEKVFVDVGEHASAGAKVVKGELETVWIGPVLRRSDGGVGGCDLEEDGGLFVGDGGLHGDLVGKGVVP